MHDQLTLCICTIKHAGSGLHAYMEICSIGGTFSVRKNTEVLSSLVYVHAHIHIQINKHTTARMIACCQSNIQQLIRISTMRSLLSCKIQYVNAVKFAFNFILENLFNLGIIKLYCQRTFNRSKTNMSLFHLHSFLHISFTVIVEIRLATNHF